MKNYIQPNLNPLLFCISILLLYGCITPKDTAVSRKMQNLTARYNYIYNSKVLLSEYNEDLAQTIQDDYEKILPVYFDPAPQIDLVLTAGTANKQLDEIITKGQTVINDKSFSNYIDDAYMLIGKANYLKGNYFTASEYFDYVAKTYKSDAKTFIMAMNWKAKSQMELNHLAYADKVLDTMLRALSVYKKNLPEPLATTAQMRIYQSRNIDAINLLTPAIRTADNKQLRIRWQYVLAQLQEKENDPQNAFITYTKVENSNAPFEMYFHANLRRIKLKALISGYKVNEDKELLSLIKDDKNLDYIDQIYYQIGELFSTEGNYKKAEENYLKSAKASTKNQNQKALSFLKIADLNFKQFSNYIKAKAYYDSTMTVLPKTHPDYAAIAKKANNLQYLTDRYEVISREDTLQMIAKLPAWQREARIKLLLKKPLIGVPTTTIKENQSLPTSIFQNDDNTLINLTVGNGSKFYFNNTAAVSNGLADFKKRWGNRPLEDNWRQSQRSSMQESSEILSGGDVASVIKPIKTIDSAGKQNQTALEKDYLAKLPIDSAMLAKSNQSIIDAYFEIATFYQQELNDKNEANKVYLELLNRYPENNQLAAIYYSLYLNNNGVDQYKSNEYKQLVLTKFPNSDFAKTILDPSYSIKKNNLEDAVNENYNQVFNNYAKKDYQEVIKQTVSSLTDFPSNDLAPQYAYLKAIAVGRTAKVDALLTEFNAIVKTYPEDKIITPLVEDHLKYIAANLAEFKQRKLALIDFDSAEPRFVNQPKPQAKKPLEVAKPADSTKIAVKVDVKDLITENAGVKTDGVFNNATSDTYYYVIDVNDASLTLTSSRFGLGQFNRGNYPDNDLVHKLIEFDNDQLIYVTSFVDLDDAKLYESSIKDQLSKIMKVPASNYRTFIISKNNFEKLTDRKRINQYLEFFKIGY
ncbi:gliding motility protein [Pedobacter changchengzhani]|uniref:Gliding motility protein n=1 Tax=Pedobacter changchengzhani TaxID=2529274 RepID=A0A4R5MQ53_9SPHI|nr:gliding motility protein [Pedobacter changchengzhani]TDG37848.1 gliding motility protein [Pedobacter changchengzhani]